MLLSTFVYKHKGDDYKWRPIAVCQLSSNVLRPTIKKIGGGEEVEREKACWEWGERSGSGSDEGILNQGC